MEFSDKLILLMDITKTSNKKLADFLHVDPSMISQLRTNRRSVSQKSTHLMKMSQYFAEHFEKESQLVEFSEIIQRNRDEIDFTPTALQSIIYEWLSLEELMFSRVTKTKKTVPSEAVKNEKMLNIAVVQGTLEDRVGLHLKFYGHLLDMKKPTTLYANSDELMEWFEESDVNSSQVREMMLGVVKKGFSVVQIVNPLAKNELIIKEMDMWVPLYLTGQVQVMYYPKYRESFFRTTDLLVPNEIMYTSSSSKEKSYFAGISVNSLQVQVQTEKMKDYLKVCKPASFSHTRARDILNCFFYYHHTETERISVCSVLGPDTIPYKEMLTCIKNTPKYEGHYKNLKKIFDDYDYVPSNPAHDICKLATVEEVMAGKVRLMMPGRAKNEEILYYTPKMYTIHLNNILRMMETNPNYHFYPYEPKLENAILLVYEENGAILTDTLEAYNVIEFKTPSMVNVLYDYAYQILQTLPSQMLNRANTMKKIKKLIKELEACEE